VYPEAAEALAVKLLEFADVKPGVSVLGESVSPSAFGQR
jgi:hypothetical protein